MNVNDSKIRRLVIAGPTAIGKTAVSIKLAKHLSGQKSGDFSGAEIISADSRQCYKYLDIGTAKILPDEMEGIPHHNISVFSPDEPDTAAAFAIRARNLEDEIIRKNKLPLVVGGSTLHIQSLIWPLDDIPGACVPNQIKLKEQEKASGSEFMMEWLRSVDPEYSTKMDGYNRNRVYRALDVFLQTGKPFSSFHVDQNLAETPDDTALFVLTAKRDYQIERIHSRVDKMLETGLIEEVSNLLKMGYSGEEQSLQTVGYKEVIRHLRGEITEDQMIQDIKTNTRRYAKRQATWFRRWKSARFIDVTGQEPHQIVNEITTRLNLPF